MKILKITTHWTPQEADAVYQFLDEFKEALWQQYGEDIVQMHKTIQDEWTDDHEDSEFNDEIPF